MMPLSIASIKNISPVRIVIPLLAIIFITELAVMELFAPFIAGSGLVLAGIVDATVLTVVYALPLHLMLSGSMTSATQTDHASLRLRRFFFWGVLAVVFSAELLVMLLLPLLGPNNSSIVRPLLDAALTSVLAAPFIWWIVSRQHPDVRADLDNSPLKLYVLLLGVVFVFDLLESELVPLIFPHGTSVPYRFYDAFVTTLITAPFLWWLMVRPLQRVALVERIRHDAIQTQVVDAIVAIDLQGTIISCNNAAEKIFGYAPAEINGQSAAILFCDDLLTPEKLNILTEPGTETEHTTHEVICQRQDGHPLALEITVSRLMLREVKQFLVIMRDISSRKAAEDALRDSELRFRQIFEQSEDAIIFSSIGSCRIIDINATAEKLFGYSKTELQAVGIDRLDRDPEKSQLRAFICDINQGGRLALDRYTAVKKDGTEMVLSVRGKVMTLQNAEIIFCSFRDITQRIRLENQSREIQAKLIQTNKMTSLGLMVSGVAHEINNPNTYILTNAQLLDKVWHDALNVLREYYVTNGDFLVAGVPFSEMESHIPEMTTGIIDGTRRINRIISDLKSFVRQDRRTVLREIDVNKTVQSAVAILQSQISRYTQQFRLELVDQLPAVKGNNQQLGQVFINLIMNACQALPDTHAGISLRSGVDEDARQVFVEIRDEGSGIPPELGKRIMDPFFTTKLDAGGTGLGLSISQSIIREHDGSLEFVSASGRGTTFTVRLPIAQTVNEEQE